MEPASEFVALLENDPRYKKWFESWWSADYSVEGYSKRSIDDPFFTPQQEFAGRTWYALNAPPHDLSGNINPNFRFDNAQTFMQWLGQRSSPYNLDAFGMFLGNVTFKTPAITLSATDCFVYSPMSIDGMGRDEEISLEFHGCYIGSPVKIARTGNYDFIIKNCIVTDNITSENCSGGVVTIDDTTMDGDIITSGRVKTLSITNSHFGGEIISISSNHIEELSIIGSKIYKGVTFTIFNCSLYKRGQIYK